MRLIFLPAVLLAVATATVDPASAQSIRPPGVGLDTRYVSADSDEAVAEFGVDLLAFGPWLARKVVAPAAAGDGALFWDGAAWNAVRRDVLSFVTSTFLGTAFGHAAHEYGHATRLAAIGFDPRMSHRSWSTVDEIAQGVRDGVGTSDFFLYFVSSLTDRSGSTVVTTERVRRSVDLEAFEDRWEAAAIMGGLNAEMAVSHRLAEEMQVGRGRAGMLAVFLNGKLAPRQYGIGESGGLNDMTNILEHYQDRGVDVDHDQIRSGSLRAALLSSGTWGLAWATLSMVRGQGSGVPELRVGPVLLPDVGFHLAPAGTSHSVHSGVRLGELVGRVSYEWITAGDERSPEVGLSLERPLDRGFGGGRVRVGEGFGGGLLVGWPLTDRVDAVVTVDRYDPRNLHGARHTTYIDGDEADRLVGLRVQYRW